MMAGSGGRRPPLLSEPFQPTLQFLTPEELFHTSDSVKNKVLRILGDMHRNLHGSEAQRRNDKAAYEQQIFELESQLREKSNAAENANVMLLEERKNTEDYVTRYRSGLSQLSALEEKNSSLEKELSSTKIKCDQLNQEKEDLLNMVEKRNVEIEKLTVDLKHANEQLQSSTVAKIEALAKVDELTSKEIELDYKEKQLEKEREWISKQVQLLNEELDKKNIELLDIQRKASSKYLGVQTELAERSEELRIAEVSLEGVKKSNEEQEKHIEQLMEKLKDAQDVEIKVEENYRQELKAQKKIAELYKESSEEASKKVEELEDAITNLQSLLKQAADRYGELEERYREAVKKLAEETSESEKKIEELNQELTDANELLTNIKKQGMTDEMIQSLSPAAAAASAMLKNSHSLTEIYSRYQGVYSELLQAKEDNEKLNSYVNQILKEITDRAPTLRRQKEDYDRCLKTIDALQDQLDLSLREISDCKLENAHLKKSNGAIDRENSRLKSQLRDLALQIKSLVKEVETSRGNYSFNEPDEVSVVPDVNTSPSQMSSSRVITDRLVTFRNIDELQQQNQHLLAVVRELSEAQEKAEKELDENQLKEMKEALEAAKTEISDLKALKNRHESMIESLSQQRDTFSALLKQQRSPVGENSKSFDFTTSQEKILGLEKIVAESNTLMQKLKEEYDTYRKEKNENDKIANEQLERLRDDLMRLRTDNAKLASQVEYNNERSKVYTANLDTYKKNIAVLEEKSKQYQLTILKHEQSIEAFKAELATTQQNLARTEVGLSSANQERNILRDAKARIQAERDLFQREHSTQQMLHINLEEIKNGLEMCNSAARIKIENELDSLQKENAALRRKNDIDNDRFKDTILAWDKMAKDLQAKNDTQEAEINAVKNELNSCQGIIRTQRKEIEELLNKVSVLTGTSVSNGQSANTSVASSPGKLNESVQGDDGSIEKKVKDLTLTLTDSQTEVKSLKQQLELARSSLEQYKTLAQAMEDQLNSANATSKNFSEDLAERLACKDDIIRNIQGRLDAAEKEYIQLKEERENEKNENENKIKFMTEEINRMRRELQTANSKLQSLVEENCTIKADMERHVQVSKDMQEKYERELALHAQDVKTGGEIKSELDELKGKADEATRLWKNSEETLKATRTGWEEREKVMTSELENMQKNLQEVESLNSSLQDQLIALTTQINSLRQVEATSQGANLNSSLDTSLNTSFSENDVKTSEQWLQLVRYLRREKEIARTKTDMAQTASQRLESQVSYLERQLEESQRQLKEIQDKSHVSVITSAKQAELLRKVETLSALTDSNRMLREEKDAAMKEIEELKLKLQNIEAEMSPLRAQNIEFETKCESLSNENISLKQDSSRWRARASSLLEKCNKVNPEEMKKLQIEKDTLQKQLTTLQDSFKKQQQELARLNLQLKTVQQNLATQQVANASLLSEKKVQMEEHKKLAEQSVKTKSEADSLQGENLTLKTSQAEQETEILRLKKELEKIQKQLEEHKNTVKTIKNIAKKYKKQYEDLRDEHSALQEKVTALDESAAAAAEVKKSVSDFSSSTSDDQMVVEQQAEEDSLRQEVARCEGRVTELTHENDGLRRDIDTVKTDCNQREERAKLAMKAIREKLNQVNQQKSDAETELSEYKQKLATAESNDDERNVRFAALKSQLEGRIAKLEKENKDLRALTAGNVGDSAVAGTSEMSVANASLLEENARLKKELEMLRQRVLALEKQMKLHSQQQVTKGTSTGNDKPQSDPPKANIKPIAGTSSAIISKQVTQAVTPAMSRPPLTASIRPMSMQRKATVMPTTAMPTQQHTSTAQPQQSSSSAGITMSPVQFIAPVSQAQVSTSTPDQSSGIEHSHHLPVTSSAATATVTNSTNVRQATVQPTPAVTITPVASTMTTNTTATVAPQGPSVERESAEIGLHEDPSTSTSSHMEDMEMGDSSEQVSSSESSSTHQQMIPVAPIRSQQLDQVQQSSQSVSGTSLTVNQGSNLCVEEPSPSTSTTGSSSRPSQSGKRGRDSEVETSQESQPTDEPENKRTRVNIPIPIDREAEAMSHQQEEFIIDDELDEDHDQEADQGRTDEENQIPHSDTSAAKPAASGIAQTDSQEDDDSDVIVIESDDEDEDDAADDMVSGRVHRDEIDDGNDDEDLEEEGEDEEEDIGDESEGSMVGTDDDGDVDDDDDDDEDGGVGIDAGIGDDQEDQGLDHDEGREAESMEDNEGDGELKIDDGEEHEADTIVVEVDESDSQQGANTVVVQDSGPSGVSAVVPVAEERDLVETVPVIQSSGSTGNASSTSSSSGILWGQSSPGTSARPVPLTRPGRQERLPSLGRQHQLTPGVQIHSQYDDMDDSIVPSTPTLFVPRRSDGFAEAVSSPHIAPQRFTFSSHGDTTTSSGLDDTRIDLHAYDDGTGRSVPTTPLQVSPPEVTDLPSGLDPHGESSHDVPGMSQEMSDVQPSSSDSSRFSQPKASAEVPTITITSALDSSLDSSPDLNLDGDAIVAVHTESESLEGVGDAHTIPGSRPEASVTSSDEDKIDAGVAVLGQTHQSAATSSSSGTASPTPSSNTPGQAGSTDLQNPQQHRLLLQGVLLPLPGVVVGLSLVDH
ncbi:unnamed protein product [Allacma fusca]|uniref:Nucleoprotein TPR n=1 Tax=Allacma fusca TaxID=39272 RepID=A0A8J2LJZ7_9HEXA|nr:unnamed protein product [Allacma fusca]